MRENCTYGSMRGRAYPAGALRSTLHPHGSDLTAGRGVWYNSPCSVDAAKVVEAGLWRGGEKSNAPKNNVASTLRVVWSKY